MTSNKKLTYSEFCEIMSENCYSKEPLKGVIVYSQDSFKTEYSLESRSYLVHSDAKYFNCDMGGNSLFGSALDGSDDNVRLDWVNWKIDYCYLLED